MITADALRRCGPKMIGSFTATLGDLLLRAAGCCLLRFKSDYIISPRFEMEGMKYFYVIKYFNADNSNV